MNPIKTISDFASIVKYALSEEFPECCIETVPIPKNNGVCLTGIAVHPRDGKIAPAIQMQPYYSALQSGIPFEKIIGQITGECRDALANSAAGIGADKIQDFASVRDRICYRLINKALNASLLAEVPNRDFHNLSIVYYIQLAYTDAGVSTSMVTNRMAQKWGVDEAQIYERAHENTPRLNRGCVIPLDRILNGCIGMTAPKEDECHAYGQFDFIRASGMELPMYDVTNYAKLYGASVLLYENLLADVAGEIGNFLILPGSIHETIFVPYKEEYGSMEDISRIVGEINAAGVDKQDILSDSMFYYDAGSHTLKLVS